MSTTLVKVMQCDRCMAKHEIVLDGYDDLENSEGLFNVAITEDHHYGKLSWTEKPSPEGVGTTHNADLCKKCTDQLSNWFDSYPLRKTE